MPRTRTEDPDRLVEELFQYMAHCSRQSLADIELRELSTGRNLEKKLRDTIAQAILHASCALLARFMRDRGEELLLNMDLLRITDEIHDSLPVGESGTAEAKLVIGDPPAR